MINTSDIFVVCFINEIAAFFVAIDGFSTYKCDNKNSYTWGVMDALCKNHPLFVHPMLSWEHVGDTVHNVTPESHPHLPVMYLY